MNPESQPDHFELDTLLDELRSRSDEVLEGPLDFRVDYEFESDPPVELPPDLPAADGAVWAGWTDGPGESAPALERRSVFWLEGDRLVRLYLLDESGGRILLETGAGTGSPEPDALLDRLMSFMLEMVPRSPEPEAPDRES